MTERGYAQWRRGSFCLRVHYSVALGMLVVSEGFDLSAAVAYLGLLVVHVTGHAIGLRLSGDRARRVTIVGWGGDCDGVSAAAPPPAAAAGGVVAQALLLLVVLWLCKQMPQLAAQPWVSRVGLEANGLLLALNLLPLRAFDGPAIWRGGRRRGRSGSASWWRSAQRWAAVRRSQRRAAGPTGGAHWQRLPKTKRQAPSGGRAEASRSADEESLTAPSASAQRELADLFERVAKEAAKARKGR